MPARVYCNATWNADDVLSKDNITYSSKYGLALRLFTPPASDRRAKRPAILAIHGGHFKSGNRNESGIVDWCVRFAQRGYVAASIDYRLLWSQLGHPGDIMAAMHDARAAVRWLRMHAAEHAVDPDRIGAFGSSAGGMTVLYLATVGGGEGDSGNPGYPSSIRAAATLSGALYPPPPHTSNLSAASPAYLDFHGCADPFVPYDCDEGCTCEGRRGAPSCWSSAVETNRQLRAAGAVAGLRAFPGAGHVPWDSLAAPAAAETMFGFFAERLGLSCP